MGIFSSIIKVNKYKRFSFSPRYYDERKEHREELIRELEEADRNKSSAPTEYRSRLNTGFIRSQRVKSKKEGSASTYRLLIIIAILSVFFYWLLR